MPRHVMFELGEVEAMSSKSRCHHPIDSSIHSGGSDVSSLVGACFSVAGPSQLLVLTAIGSAYDR